MSGFITEKNFSNRYYGQSLLLFDKRLFGGQVNKYALLYSLVSV